MADIVGRRFGHQKLPYNGNKSIVGSISMAIAGFLASVGYATTWPLLIFTALTGHCFIFGWKTRTLWNLDE